MSRRAIAAGILQPFRSPRVALLLALGFASGLPFELTGNTLGAWMATVGVDLKTIGLFALVSLPYSLKFLWAPLIDRFVPPWLGRRRGWMVLTQLLLVAAIAATGTLDPRSAPFAVAVLALLVTFLSASQDIVCDAYRSDLLPASERAAGTATFVLGYRVAMLVSGGLALILSVSLSWRSIYFLMAATMVVGLIATLRAPEPPTARPPRTLAEAVFEPFRDYFRRPGAIAALAVIAFYKFGHLLAYNLTTPFLIRLGFGNAEIGLVQKWLGLGATIVGALLGGGLVAVMGVRRALLGFGLLQAVATLGYVALALVGPSHPLLFVAIGADRLATGMSIIALEAFLLSLCSPRYSATQYALFTSVSGLLARTVGAGAGSLVEHIGWAAFFAGTSVVSLPVLAAIALLPDGAAAPKPEPEPAQKAD